MTLNDFKKNGSFSDKSRDDTGSSNFIRHIIDEDINTGKFGGKVETRFPA